jgi:DNA polymerase III subunit gamma/tau
MAASAPERPAPADEPTTAGTGAADDWPATAPSGSASPAAAAPPAPDEPSAARQPDRRPGVASGEPDIPLPPEPDDDEDWPQPARPAAPATAPARPATAPASGPTPRAAAEHSPSPRGGEPTPLVSAAPEPAADGALTTADVRRIWPELLAVVKRHKRTTEALLKSAQVHDLSNGGLTLAATSPALAKMLGDDLNKDIVRQSLEELLGVRWKVNVVVDTPGQPAPAATPEAARAATRAAETAEAEELLAERAADAAHAGDGAAAPVLDAEQAALRLLRAQLGAHPIDS